ncbi:MAG: RDD family protein [Planctomycetota bacterium]
MHTGQRVAAYVVDAAILWCGMSLLLSLWSQGRAGRVDPPPDAESAPPAVLLPRGDDGLPPGFESVPPGLLDDREVYVDEEPGFFDMISSYFAGILTGALRRPVSLLLPLLYFGLFTGLAGATPGKFVTRIRVANRLGRRPGLARGMAREALKLAAVTLVIPALIALLQLHGGRPAWYDRLCRTHIEALPPWVSRTRSQKNFLKHYKDVR